KLELYPKGYATGYNKGISLYLFLVDFTDLINGKKLYVEYELRVRNLLNKKDATRMGRGWYVNTEHNRGIPNLLSLSDLHNSEKGFKIDDKVIVEVKLNLMVLDVHCLWISREANKAAHELVYHESVCLCNGMGIIPSRT
ncbi:MATH domain and coiled-coil domain-containing protein, partial [Drosera capensis]